MRVILTWLLFPLIFHSLLAEEEAAAEAMAEAAKNRSEESPVPWIGLEIGKLDDVMRAHASGVPEGVGFLVRTVTKNGPAMAAGLQKYDILWKFEDQLLVNQAQFATILRLKKIGDRVKVSVVRSGTQLELDLVLGKMPVAPKLAGFSPSDLPLVPNGVPGMTQVRVTPLDRVAELTRADGSSAKLYYKDGQPFVTILDADEGIIYEGSLREDGKFIIPEDWHRSVGAMQRSLFKAKNPDWAPRRPRPRVVIPSNQEAH